MLSVDFPIGYAKMRFSYLADLQQSDVNKIKTHTYSHVFMVGFVKELYTIRESQRSLSFTFVDKSILKRNGNKRFAIIYNK